MVFSQELALGTSVESRLNQSIIRRLTMQLDAKEATWDIG